MNNKIKFKNYKKYFNGFVFSIILTIIPFISIIKHLFEDKKILIFILLICAIIQIIVHLIYFLNINLSLNQRLKLISFIFTIIISLILVVGTFCIMYSFRN